MHFPISIAHSIHRFLCLMLASFSLAAHALTFDEAMQLAQSQAPQIKAQEEILSAAQSGLQPAGALPDPKLALGIQNLPIDGAERYSVTSEPMTMRSIGVIQEFPSSSKLQARESAAQGRVALADSQLQTTRLVVARQLASAWIARVTLEQQLARMDDLRKENRLLDVAVKAMLSGGKGAASDAVMPRQEAAMIENRVDELNASRSRAIAALRRWIGEAAEDGIQGAMPDWPVASASLVHGVHQHPELLEFDARAQVMDAEISAATAEKNPDWMLELMYQKRGDQYGDMASFQVSFDLPIFSGSRQDPKIAARRAERAGLDAERDATRREHVAMIEADLAEYHRLDSVLTRQRDVLLPLATEKIELAMAAWRGGKGSLSDVIAARRDRIDTELKIIELDGQRRQIAARLHYVNTENGALP